MEPCQTVITCRHEHHLRRHGSDVGTGLCGCDQRRLGSAEAALDLLVWIHNIFSVRNLASGFEEIWKMGRYGFSVVVKKEKMHL